MRKAIIEKLSAITPEEQRLLRGEAVDFTVYNHAGDPMMEPGTLMPDGRLFGIRPHTRFVDFPRHGHEYVEMIYQAQGRTVHRLDGETTLTLESGQLLLLGRGSHHAIQAAGREDLAVNFFLLPAFFDNAALSLGTNNALAVFLKGNLQNRRLSTGYLVFDVSDSVLIQNLLENLILGQMEDVSLQTQQLTLEVLLQHLSGMAEKLVAETRAERERAVVLQILSRMERHMQTNLSETAAELHMEVTALSRMIKRYTGCTFTQLLHTARFSRAAALLRDTDMSVADIATAVGYENTAFFYRQFHMRFGCTPAAYRAQSR